MRTTVTGSFYYNPGDGSGYANGVTKGDVVELGPEAVITEIRNGRAETRLEGPIGAYTPASPETMADLRADLRRAK